ncbi:alpha-1,2-mannosyltransferase [Trypanosoma theileri]|uniref:Alpha-1,2-mannosyltransferase n=1 Tax=Trypanosoma theileri TaxID=67003 RepID=A0A1X0NY70_9TRYP|nr:alpha-1,2-mannosyltransferase [Trypanosoma theileri]ORC89110.1 alpha-1,2-mannosyltransferase [Trypanosoma theileri]
MSKKELVERKHDFSSGPATQRVSFVEAVCTAALRCNNMRTEVNGVILFLAGKKEPLFYEKTLPLLDMNFLAYYPYPVHVFHEDMSLGTQEEIRDVLPSARSVTFEDVSQFWRTLPHGVSEEQLNEWMNTPEQLRYHKRGYRIMCRFWAGLVWQLPSLDSYEYYWRLDTDSFLTKTVPCDVFRLMHRRQCSYGYRLITLDSVNVVKDLWPTFEKWAVTALSTNELESVTRFALRDNTTEYTRMMYYNNFELGTIALKRHPLYTSMFRFLDENEPLGILRYRWGDAPIHTLGVEAVMLREGWRKCHFDRNFAGYKHGK